MQAATVERTQPQYLAPIERSVADQLDAIRAEIQELQADLDFSLKEQSRCLAAAEDHAAIRALPAAAKAALESLHAARFAGEEIEDEEIAVAEEALRLAHVDAQKAESAEVGARKVAAKFEAAAAKLHDQVLAARARAKPLIEQILRNRALRSISDYRTQAETFAKGVHTRHHAEVLAIAEMAKANGLGNIAFPNQTALWVEFATTPTTDDGANVRLVVECQEAINAEARRVAAELHGLLP